jgi:hypothetical protein
MTAAFSDLISRIEAIATELDDIAFDHLREAVAEGSGVRPTSDRKLMQVRRALDKAAAVLAQVELPVADQAT